MLWSFKKKKNHTLISQALSSSKLTAAPALKAGFFLHNTNIYYIFNLQKIIS